MFGPGAVSLSFRRSLCSLFLSNRAHLIDFPLSQGTVGSRWELRHLAGSPGGGGGVFKLCHTLIRVNTV